MSHVQSSVWTSVVCIQRWESPSNCGDTLLSEAPRGAETSLLGPDNQRGRQTGHTFKRVCILRGNLEAHFTEADLWVPHQGGPHLLQSQKVLCL